MRWKRVRHWPSFLTFYIKAITKVKSTTFSIFPKVNSKTDYFYYVCKEQSWKTTVYNIDCDLKPLFCFKNFLR